jgi:hypothetical protein
LHEPKTFLTAPPAAGTIMGHLAQPIKLGPPAENDLIDNITNRQK